MSEFPYELRYILKTYAPDPIAYLVVNGEVMNRATTEEKAMLERITELEAQFAAVTAQRDAARRCSVAWKDAAKDWRHEAKRLNTELATAELELPNLSEQLAMVITQRDAAVEALKDLLGTVEAMADVEGIKLYTGDRQHIEAARQALAKAEG